MTSHDTSTVPHMLCVSRVKLCLSCVWWCVVAWIGLIPFCVHGKEGLLHAYFLHREAFTIPQKTVEPLCSKYQAVTAPAQLKQLVHKTESSDECVVVGMQLIRSD